MLVAGASLSLMTPLVAQASNVNIEEMDSYSRSSKSSNKQFDSKTFANELATTNERVDGIESRINAFEAGGFSDTTSAMTQPDSSSIPPMIGMPISLPVSPVHM